MAKQAEDVIQVIPDGKIIDYVDGTLRNDTPEEYVRQNIEKRLILEHRYSREQIKVEFSVKLGSSRKRVDLAIFPENESHNQDNIHIIIECKKEKIEPSNRKEGVEQLKSYISACPNCEWGMWTNGKFKAVFRKVVINGKITWTEPNDIPSKDGNIEDIDRPKRSTLKNATEDNLLFTFRTCHNHIYVNDGLQKQPAFFELLKVIFCKILDERTFPKPLEFFAASTEKASPDGQLTVKNRIGKIFKKVKKRYPTIFDPNDKIKLKPRSLAYIVSELQKYSFLDTHIDVKGKAYEELVGSNLRGDRGEFFTPRNIQKMAINMLDIKSDETILDPASGTGGFLVIAMNSVIQNLKAQMVDETGIKDKKQWPDNVKSLFQDTIKEIAESNYFGIDINPDLVKATKMNMVMNNDGSGNIFRQDSLLPPHEWSLDFKDFLCSHFGLPKNSLRNYKDIGLFDIIATNPPFGSKLPIKDTTVLEQFDLGHKWKKTDGKFVITSDLQGSVPPEILFIERCWQFLKPGGRYAIVLPDAILGAPGLEYVREWIIQKCRIVASIDLHPDTFQPHNGTQTSVLVLQKKTEEEMNKEKIQGRYDDYNIFMAIIEHIGHDKRGNSIFKRDVHGNEILVPEDKNIIEIEEIASGQKTARRTGKKKVLDDETDDIADEFLRWKEEEVLGW